MAKMHEMMNNKSKVKKCFQQAIKVAKTSVKRHRSDDAYRRLFETYGKMGDWYESNKRFKSALKCYDEAIYLAKESVAVYQDVEDKCYLAKLYYKAGILPTKNGNSFLEKSMILWQELMQADSTSQAYQDGYDMVCQALNTDNSSYPSASSENQTMTLTDENGNEKTYELLDFILENNSEYVVLMSVEDTETDVLILRVDKSNKDEGCTSYSGVDDELAAKIFKIFKKRNKDNFNFVD